MTTKTDRRVDRSDILSEALDKLLESAATQHDLVAAVVADTAGLLVATARDNEAAKRVAGVVSLIDALRDSLETYQVLDGLSYILISAPERQHLVVWSFDLEGEDMLLALLVRGEVPDQELADHLVQGVKRIFTTVR